MTLPAVRNTHLLSFMRRAGYSILGLFFIAFVSAGIAIVVLNVEQEQAKDSAVFGNLETIQTQSTISAPYEPFDAADCESGLFTEPTIASALLAIRIANGGGDVRCLAADGSFVVVAQRPDLGFFSPPTPYWCVDSKKRTCPVGSSEAVEADSCPCNLNP